MVWSLFRVFSIIVILQSTYGAEIEKLKDVKTANATDVKAPGSVDSRFFDLGGMFNNMFQGFTGGRQRPGNAAYPGYGQYQPGYLPNNYPQGGGGNWQNNGGPQNQYPYYQNNPMQNQGPPNGGMQNGYPNQGQQINTPYQNQGQGMNGQFQNQGQQMNGPSQNQGGFSEQQNINQQPRERPGNIQYPQDQEEYPNESQNNNYPDQGQGGDGTLDDIVPTNPNSGRGPKPSGPLNRPDEVNDQKGSSSGIWKPIAPPSSTVSPDTIYFSESTESPAKKQCVQDCQSTSEYNPICGSNNVTYFNPGRFVCARNCGVNVYLFKQGRCNV